MAGIGLFSRVDLQQAVAKKKHVRQIDIDQRVAGELSLDAFNSLMPNQIEPYVQEGAQCLIIAKQVDDSGKLPVNRIGNITYELDCNDVPYALDAMVRSLQIPKMKPEVLRKALARQVRDSVLKIKPKVVLALDADVAKILIPDLEGSVVELRGQAFPARVAGHYFWLVVTHDPRGAQKDDYDRYPTWYDAILWDARLAAEMCSPSAKINKTYMEMSRDQLRAFGEYATTDRVKALRLFFKRADRRIAMDYETKTLMPWMSKDARITAISFSDGALTLSIPFDHKYYLGADDRAELIEVFKEGLKGRTIFGHNVQFELIWTFWIFGKDVVFSVDSWKCSQAAAYVNFIRAASYDVGEDDEEPGVAGTSLEAQGLLYFGIDIKGLSPDNSWNEDEVTLEDHLIYNALDSFFCFHIYVHQCERLEVSGLFEVYEKRIERFPFLAWSTVRGMPINQDAVEGFWNDAGAAENAAHAALKGHEDVVAFTKKFGTFEPSKPAHVAKLLSKICGVQLEKTAKGKDATDKKELLTYADEHPVVKLIIEAREVSKLKSTYIKKLRASDDDTYIGCDGKIHCLRSATKAVTGRHAHSRPNGANFPARGPQKKIRRAIAAREGWSIVSIDMGQIEARIIAVYSKDQHFLKSLRVGGLDVHKDWAQKLTVYDAAWARQVAKTGTGRFEDKMHDEDFQKKIMSSFDFEIEDLEKEYEEAAALRGKYYQSLPLRHKFDLKGLRGLTKNGMVFPAFFGAGAFTICTKMLMVQQLVQWILKSRFWKEFTGVKEWQKKVSKFYDKHGYVESLSGFRFYGPLSYNNIINYPVQNLASEILQDGAGRIVEQAYKLALPWLVPIIDIHDDLTFHVPDDCISDLIRIVVPIMLRPTFNFIDVPLTCEVKKGKNWCDMTEIAVYSSEQTTFELDLSHAN